MEKTRRKLLIAALLVLLAVVSALVIADLNAGPLRDAAIVGGDMLLVGGLDPLHMPEQERRDQKVRPIDLGGDMQ